MRHTTWVAGPETEMLVEVLFVHRLVDVSMGRVANGTMPTDGEVWWLTLVAEPGKIAKDTGVLGWELISGPYPIPFSPRRLQQP